MSTNIVSSTESFETSTLNSSSGDLSCDSIKGIQHYNACDYCTHCSKHNAENKRTMSGTEKKMSANREEPEKEFHKSASFPFTLTSSAKDNDNRNELILKNGDELQGKIKKKKKVKKRISSICTVNCRFEIVRTISEKFGMKDVKLADDWDIYWTDFTITGEKAKDLRSHQRLNHFPGMNEICRKDLLGRNLNRMAKLFPQEYKIFPKTWCLPADLNDVLTYSKSHSGKTYILKPETGCRGNGIVVTKNIKKLKSFDRMICQLYIEKPLLIDGLKFDLRVYTLISSCDPLRVYIYNEGLARFATSEYKEPSDSNTKNLYMHLTNYSLNKHSRYYVANEAGTKRRLSAFNQELEKQTCDVKEIWRKIDDVIIKTIILAYPTLKHSYRTCFLNHNYIHACFELLGFDILLDNDKNPFVLEVNHSPSYHTERPIDREIKEALLSDTFKLLNLSKSHKRRIVFEEKKRITEELDYSIERNGIKHFRGLPARDSIQKKEDQLQAKWEEEHLGNFRKVYPSNASYKYQPFLNQLEGMLFNNTLQQRMKRDEFKTQHNDIKAKEEKENNYEKNIRLAEEVKKIAEQNEREYLERLEIQKIEKKKLDKERRERERLERENMERQRLEKERVEKERLARERFEMERIEKERLEKERSEKERFEKQRLEKERLAKEQSERERLAKERTNKERLEKEKYVRNSLMRESLKKECIQKNESSKSSNFSERGKKHTSVSKFQKQIGTTGRQENNTATSKCIKRKDIKKEKQACGSMTSVEPSVIKPNFPKHRTIEGSKINRKPSSNNLFELRKKLFQKKKIESDFSRLEWSKTSELEAQPSRDNLILLKETLLRRKVTECEYAKEGFSKMFDDLKSLICTEIEKEINYGRSENQPVHYLGNVASATQSLSSVIQILSQASLRTSLKDDLSKIEEVKLSLAQRQASNKAPFKNQGSGMKRPQGHFN